MPADCTAANPLTCVDRAAYLHDMFLASDTTMAVLSDLPSTDADNDPLPFNDADETWQLAASLTRGGAGRLLLQNVVTPNFGSLPARLEGMTQTAATRRLSAFKVYTAWGPGGHGYDLDDPEVGLPVVQHAHDLGVNVLCAHKGLPLPYLNLQTALEPSPRRGRGVPPVPRMQFVVYHSAWTPYHAEGPYNPADPVGVDSLLTALDKYDVPPNSNVWADVAAMWRDLLPHPVQAAHALGKLLSRLGEDRLLWGTDSVWYGPPQTQIMAFRAFQISAEFQERYGYPALTDAIKAKVLGLNAAQLWGVDPNATRCELAADLLERSRPVARVLAAEGELPAPWVPRGAVTRGAGAALAGAPARPMAARLAARDLDALGVLSPPPTSALTVSPVRPVEAAIVRAITSWPASGHSRTGISDHYAPPGHGALTVNPPRRLGDPVGLIIFQLSLNASVRLQIRAKRSKQPCRPMRLPASLCAAGDAPAWHGTGRPRCLRMI